MSQVSVPWQSTWHPISNEQLGFSWPLHRVFYSWETKPRQWWGNRIQNISSVISHITLSKKCHLLLPLAFCGFFSFELQLLTPHSFQKSHANDLWFLTPWISPMPIWNLKKLRWFGFHPSHERSVFSQGLVPTPPHGKGMSPCSALFTLMRPLIA